MHVLQTHICMTQHHDVLLAFLQLERAWRTWTSHKLTSWLEAFLSGLQRGYTSSYRATTPSTPSTKPYGGGSQQLKLTKPSPMPCLTLIKKCWAFWRRSLAPKAIYMIDALTAHLCTVQGSRSMMPAHDVQPRASIPLALWVRVAPHAQQQPSSTTPSQSTLDICGVMQTLQGEDCHWQCEHRALSRYAQLHLASLQFAEMLMLKKVFMKIIMTQAL